MIPRAGRGSGTRGRVLGYEVLQVCSELVGVDRCRAGKGGEDGCSIDEASSSQWGQLADADTVSGDDEALSRVKGAHDFAALVAQLSLSDLPCHHLTVAPVRLYSQAQKMLELTWLLRRSTGVGSCSWVAAGRGGHRG